MAYGMGSHRMYGSGDRVHAEVGGADGHRRGERGAGPRHRAVVAADAAVLEGGACGGRVSFPKGRLDGSDPPRQA